MSRGFTCEVLPGKALARWEVRLFKALVVAPQGAHHAGPGAVYDKNPLPGAGRHLFTLQTDMQEQGRLGMQQGAHHSPAAIAGRA